MIVKKIVMLLLALNGVALAASQVAESPLESSIRALRIAQAERFESARQAKLMSWNTYYYGDEKRGLPSHEKEVNDAVMTGKLDLKNKQLADLDGFDSKHIPGLEHLQELNLAINEIKTLNNILPLVKLQKLFAGHNMISEIPIHIDYLKDLTEFDIAKNRLKVLPTTIGNLSELKRLSVAKNQLTSLPASITKLGKLERMYLHDNQLSSLPSLRTLHALGSLTLYNNPLAGTTADLQKKLGLPDDIFLIFKSPEEEEAEAGIFFAIRQEELSAVQLEFKAIVSGKTKHEHMGHFEVDISKIRLCDGNNLLHEVIVSRDAKVRKSRQQSTARIKKIMARIREIGEESKLGRQGVDEEKLLREKHKLEGALKHEKERINRHLEEVDKRYVQIFMALVQFGGQKVEQMILTRNKNGADVIQAALGSGFNELVQAIFRIGALEKIVHGKPAPKFSIIPREKKPEVDKEKKEREEKIAAAAQPKELSKKQQHRTNQALFAAIVDSEPLEAIIDLIDNKHAQIDGQDADGKTPLIIAASVDRPDVVEALLARVKDKEQLKKYLAMRDKRAMVWGEAEREVYEGRTALMWAEHFGNRDVIKILQAAQNSLKG